MEQVVNYLKDNYDSYIEELKDYLRIPSISTLDENKKDVNKCADFVKGLLKDAGMKKVKIYPTEGHPLVYGEWMGAPGKPTVLIYGHYDVQPVDPLELWTDDPFDPVIKDGKLFARGSSDNKGQNYAHIKAVEAYMKTKGELPVNVKFLIEGEEEIGSHNLEVFLKSNKKLLACDAVMVSDTSMFAPGIPTVSYGLRGLCYMEIEMTGPNRDLHSGTFGGSVANPINELSRLIAKLQNKNNKVTIPGFYDDVLKMTKKEKENLKRLKFSERNYARDLQVKELQGEGSYSTLERLWSRPTLDCNGIVGGFTGKGAKTVLPSKATAKISMRLVPNQTPKKIAQLFKKYVKELAPKSVKIDVRELHGGKPLLVPIEDKMMDAAAAAASKAWGKKAVFTREGGSIPIMVDLYNQLNAPVILMGIGLDSDNIHSPNEHFVLENFEKGMISSAYFLEEVAKQK